MEIMISLPVDVVRTLGDNPSARLNELALLAVDQEGEVPPGLIEDYLVRNGTRIVATSHRKMYVRRKTYLKLANIAKSKSVSLMDLVDLIVSLYEPRKIYEED